MPSLSLLFRDPTPKALKGEAPPCLSDLNLDLVIDAITEPPERHHLKPYFYTPLHEDRDVLYRQEVMKDLENPRLKEVIRAFIEDMARVNRHLTLAEKLDFEYHRKGWFLEGVLLYCETLTCLGRRLDGLDLKSQGFRAFRDYLTGLLASPSFQSLALEARKVKEALSQVRFCIIVQDGKFKVKRYEGEEDYSLELERTFEKFKKHQPQKVEVKASGSIGTSHIDAKILEFVVKLYPQPFKLLDTFWESHRSFLDRTILHLEKELKFYLAYMDFMEVLKKKGLPFCYPRLSTTSKEEEVKDSFDIALAHLSHQPPVLNGYFLKERERIIVVTGPNQGGKTTFARMFGQLHYLASLGVPVPGREAQLFLGDQVLTHFQREENVLDLRGRLEDDLIRMHHILSQASPSSIFIINEIFSSTTLRDALTLSGEIINQILDLDALGIWVTFVDQVSRLDERIVSMVATVSDHDPTVRTFRIVRNPADGRAYALSLAQKHRLTYREVKERIK